MRNKVIVCFLSLVALMLLPLSVSAQNDAKARQILDKTANILNRKGGATANFTISSSSIGNVSGTVSIKGNKFYVHTPKATTWFNGKTQWTYLSSSNEVNVSNPSAEQQAQINPYKFITMYKTGYNLSMTQKGNAYQIHLKAKTAGKSIQEMYVTISKSNNLPTQVKMKQKGKWTTIAIKNFRNAQLADSHFVFNSKDYPKAEVIDLR